MMCHRITMPVALMANGRDAGLYAHYAVAAQQTGGVYTASDHRGILKHLIRQWRLLKKKRAPTTDKFVVVIKIHHQFQSPGSQGNRTKCFDFQLEPCLNLLVIRR